MARIIPDDWREIETLAGLVPKRIVDASRHDQLCRIIQRL